MSLISHISAQAVILEEIPESWITICSLRGERGALIRPRRNPIEATEHCQIASESRHNPELQEDFRADLSLATVAGRGMSLID